MKHFRTFITLFLTIAVPIIISCIVSVLKFKDKILLQNLESLLENITGIMATLFGFILTALSILLAFEGNEKTRQLRDSRHYKTILGTYLISALYMLLGLIIFVVCSSFSIINERACFIYIFFTTICFLYLLLSLYYLVLMVITLFHKKKEYH